MAFYDVNAAIEKPNTLNAFRQGQQYGQALGKQRQEYQDANALRGLAPQVISGDPAAYEQAAAIDPKQAQALQGAGDDQLRRMKGAIDFIDAAQKSGNPQQVERAYQQVKPYLARFGQEPPATFAEAAPKFQEAKLRIAMASQGGGDDLKSLRIGRDGYYYAIQGGQLVNTGIQADARTQLRDQPGIEPGLVDLRTGEVNPLGGPSPQGAPAPQPQTQFTGPDGLPISIGDDIPENVRQDIIANPGAWNAAPDGSAAQLPPVNAGPSQGGPAAARPAIAPAEQQRLAIAEQANQRAAEASQRANEAAEAAKRGNAPAGFRFKADGSLEPIPGGPKPAGAVASEDERKAAAWLAQSRNAYQNMLAVIDADPDSAEPGFLETYIPNDELANRSRSDTRQQYVQAASSLSEALLRAATGAGVNRDEAVQKIRELTPQRGDSEAVRKQKLDAIPVYLAALEARAGRAAPGMQQQASAPAGPQPGAVQDGYRFKGGNPADPNSWERL